MTKLDRNNSFAPETHAVEASRLAMGTWCHRTEKLIGEGDIRESYSGDRIGMGQPVRRPFRWRGGYWVCTSMNGRKGDLSAEAYRLTPMDLFQGETVTYRERVLKNSASRRGANGFYHAMRVRHGGKDFVLCGPPATFVPGAAETQLSLF